MQPQADPVTVIVRVRPLLAAERAHGDVRSTCRCSGHALILDEPESPYMREILQSRDNSSTMLAATPLVSYTFHFDQVLDMQSSQSEVYERTAQPAVQAVLEGFNATVIAYGMTGAGKTFTMEGASGNREQRGVSPRALEHIFEHIRTCTDPSMRFLVRASYLQIYNESISDLLNPERTGLSVREDRRRGLFVEGLSEWVVRSSAEVGRLLAKGQSARATGSTRANELSSRSHAVVLVVVEQTSVPAARGNGEGGASGGGGSRAVRVGKLNLVDLAGSERLSASDASGARLQESKKINTSLSALGNVVAALSDRANGRLRAHIPYRDSKLTRLLEDSLGGNCKTTLIALVSPAAHAFPESLSTLKFATRAKTVRNLPTVNMDEDGVDQGALLRAYEEQLAQLRAELAQRSRTLIDSARLLELEQLHRRAEEDRLEAARALEQRTAEYLSEKAHKRTLEARIAQFQSQLLGRPAAALAEGGGEPALAGIDGLLEQHALQQQQQQPGLRLVDELERERAAVEEDKAAVVRYKALLVKQRDLMLALTRRLTERDNSLLQLQAELDAAEARALELEDDLDARTLELLTLQRVALEHGVPQGELAVSPAHIRRLLARYGPTAGGALEPVAETETSRPHTSPLAGTECLAGFPVPRPFADGGAADGGARRAGAEGAGGSTAGKEGGGPRCAAGDAQLSELRAALEAATARTAELESALAAAQDALVATASQQEEAMVERVRELVDAEVEQVAADAVQVVAEAKAARRAADQLQAQLEGVRAQLQAAEAERDARVAEVRAVEAELSDALADARTMLARTGRGDGVSDDARSSTFAEAALGGQDASLEERMRLLRRVCAAAIATSASADMTTPRVPPGAADAALRAEVAEKHVLRLKHRCAAHIKERAALTSILDKKVKVLVDELAKSLLTCVPAPATPQSNGVQLSGDSPSMKAALKQVGVLQKLVHAAVAALKMPDAAGESGSEEL